MMTKMRLQTRKQRNKRVRRAPVRRGWRRTAAADYSAAEDDQALLRGRAQTPKVNQSWRRGDDRRQVSHGNSPSASAERGELTFLPAFRRGIRLSELSKQRSFYGRTDSIVGGWAAPPSERLARFKSGSNKARKSLRFAFLQCAYFTNGDRRKMLDLLMARYANEAAAQQLNVQMHVVNIVHGVLLPELMIELIRVACGGETVSRAQAIEFLDGGH
jgi:hypothetical protein